MSQYCINCIISFIFLTQSSKFAINQFEISFSLFRWFSSTASFFKIILCIFNMHSFMSSAFKSFEFKTNNLLSCSWCFAQLWLRSFFLFWIFSSWVISHFLQDWFDFSCFVVSLDSSLALNSRFERNERSEYNECDCNVLMNLVMSNLKKQLAK